MQRNAATTTKGKYWKAEEKVMETQRTRVRAQEISDNPARYKECLKSSAFYSKVEQRTVCIRRKQKGAHMNTSHHVTKFRPTAIFD